MSGALYIVVPAFNEEAGIGPFLDEVAKVFRESRIQGSYECMVVIVDDGSTDRTLSVLRQHGVRDARRLGQEPGQQLGQQPGEQRREEAVQSGIRVVCISLSRNFGHQSAIHAGLDYARQQCRESRRNPSRCYVILMDSDLQHPPRLLPGIVSELERGTHHVQMIRQDSGRTGFFKRISSRMFYQFFRWISDVELLPGGSDFRGFSMRFVESYFQLPEKGRFNRGLFQWMGYSTIRIPYVPDERVAGHSKYSLIKMLRLGMTGLTYFSSKPLIFTLSALVGLSVVVCVAYGSLEFSRYLEGYRFTVGWTTVIFFIFFWGGTLAFSQLLLGIYISRIFDEVKSRPVYLVQSVFDSWDSRAGGGGIRDERGGEEDAGQASIQGHNVTRIARG